MILLKKKFSKKETHSKKLLNKYPEIYLFSADEALHYSTIYPNSRDLGTAHASLAFSQLRM